MTGVVEVEQHSDGGWQMSLVTATERHYLFDGDEKHRWFEDLNVIARRINADPRLSDALAREDLDSAFEIVDENVAGLPVAHQIWLMSCCCIGSWSSRPKAFKPPKAYR